MAETKIKVNELATATPTLNDTLLGSNATKEYACKIEDLASLVGGGGILLLTATGGTLDKTWQEIWDAVHNNAVAFIINSFETVCMFDFVTSITGDGEYYTLETAGGADPYVATDPNGYPHATIG